MQTECPVCHEPAGEPCRTGNGLVMQTPHWQRLATPRVVTVPDETEVTAAWLRAEGGNDGR